ALPIYFEEAWMALVGTDAGGLSASTIARLKEIWAEEHARWQQPDLSSKRYVCLWADGESALSWKELLLDLKRRGLDVAPELAIADGALGFWKGLCEVGGKTTGHVSLGQ